MNNDDSGSSNITTRDATTAAATTVRRSLIRRHRASLICALVLLIMAVNFLTVIRQKSITIDETLLIPAGYYHLTANDFRPVSEHPPFAKMLGALPLMFMDVHAPLMISQSGLDYEYYLNVFDAFWRTNDARFELMTFWARVPLICVTLLLGALVFVYARRLFNERAALFAVVLFALEPTILAHGRVVQTDIPSALAYLLFSFTLYDYLVRGTSLRRAAYTGLSAGLAVVTKFSMIVLCPLLAVLLVALFALAPRRGQRRADVAWQALVLSLAFVLVVNAAYLFQHRAPDAYAFSFSSAGFSPWMDEVLRAPLSLAASVLQIIFPPDFIYGICWQIAHNHNGHQAGLLGMYSTHGWWYYFPIAFALKTTMPFLLLSLASLSWAVWNYYVKRESRWLALLVPFTLYTGLVMLSGINIGVRYYLPAIPFLCIACGAFLDRLLARHNNKRRQAFALVAVIIVLGWCGIETARAYPDYMPYMNQLAARAPQWWYLSDSNVEWGDDIRDLALYLRAHGEQRAGAAILNWQILERYGITQVGIFTPPGMKPEETRYVAVGASFLNGSTVPGQVGGVELSEEQRVNYFDEYRRRSPEKVFGNSIYLYRIKE